MSKIDYTTAAECLKIREQVWHYSGAFEHQMKKEKRIGGLIAVLQRLRFFAVGNE